MVLWGSLQATTPILLSPLGPHDWQLFILCSLSANSVLLLVCLKFKELHVFFGCCLFSVCCPSFYVTGLHLASLLLWFSSEQKSKRLKWTQFWVCLTLLISNTCFQMRLVDSEHFYNHQYRFHISHCFHHTVKGLQIILFKLIFSASQKLV